MTTELKVKLANLTIVIITLTVVVVFFWFVVQTVSSAFHLNVFAEKTSEFFILLLGAALAIVFSAALLNICLNLSILADARIRELPTQQNATFGKSFFLILAGLLLAIIASLFGGDYLSRRQEKDRLISECNDLVSRYQVSVDKIATALKDTSIIDDIPTILEFLSSQKSDYNDIALIVATEFDGQTTFLHMNDNMLSSSLKIPYWVPPSIGAKSETANTSCVYSKNNCVIRSFGQRQTTTICTCQWRQTGLSLCSIFPSSRGTVRSVPDRFAVGAA